jgi:hypothetical protein
MVPELYSIITATLSYVTVIPYYVEVWLDAVAVTVKDNETERSMICGIVGHGLFPRRRRRLQR